MLKHTHSHLKRNGYNPVFYNYLNENNKDQDLLIQIMLKRLSPNYRNTYNKIIFYDNHTKEVYKQVIEH